MKCKNIDATNFFFLYLLNVKTINYVLLNCHTSPWVWLKNESNGHIPCTFSSTSIWTAATIQTWRARAQPAASNGGTNRALWIVVQGWYRHTQSTRCNLIFYLSFLAFVWIFINACMIPIWYFWCYATIVLFT